MAGTRHPTDWERQREQLSAYLDGELSAAERASLERHLPSCPECTLELRELRRVRALLGALPTPAAPRSFVLPVSASQPARSSAHHSRPALASRPAWSRTAQWVGGVAACIGLFLMLGSAILGMTGSTLSGTPQYDRPISGASAQSTPSPADARVSSPSQTASQTGATYPAPTATAPKMASYPPPRESAPPLPLGPITGAGLLVGGLALVVIGRGARR